MSGKLTITSGLRHEIHFLPQPIQLFPRCPKHLVHGGRVRIKPLLPDYYPDLEPGRPIKCLEYNFYPDVNTVRTLSALAAPAEKEKHGKPFKEGITVYWRLDTAVSSKYAKLGVTESKTDKDGIASVTVEHPAQTFTDSPNLIQIQASLDKGFSDRTRMAGLCLKICRNDDIDSSFSQVLAGRSLLVFQPENQQSSEGVKELQRLLNHVVARHKAADKFQWLPIDGKYDDACLINVAEFLRCFAGEYNYEKGHFNIVSNKKLREYLQTEYGISNLEDGHFVDRDVLVGKNTWQQKPKVEEINGLLDIYRGVVECYFRQMVVRCNEYCSCDVYWLHSPRHQPYTEGEGPFLRIQATKHVYAEDGNTKSRIPNHEIPSGSVVRLLPPQPGDTWLHIDGGWIRPGRVRQIRKDANHSENTGIFGSRGVAYSYARKDLPFEFQRFMQRNNPRPQSRDVNLIDTSILCWEEYENGNKPGREDGDPGENNWTGVDCSGFVQNCLTHAMFEIYDLDRAGRITPRYADFENAHATNDDRIIPQSFMVRITKNAGGWYGPNDCIPADGFVDNYARQMPYNSLDEERQWLDQGDLIATGNHIAFVAERQPDSIRHHREFFIYNAYGEYYCHNETAGSDIQTAAFIINPDPSRPNTVIPTGQFIRKVMKMKFKWWGIQCDGNGVMLGRVYFWK